METGAHRGALNFSRDLIDAGERGALMAAPLDFVERLWWAAEDGFDTAVTKVAHPAVEAQ